MTLGWVIDFGKLIKFNFVRRFRILRRELSGVGKQGKGWLIYYLHGQHSGGKELIDSGIRVVSQKLKTTRRQCREPCGVHVQLWVPFWRCPLANMVEEEPCDWEGDAEEWAWPLTSIWDSTASILRNMLSMR